MVEKELQKAVVEMAHRFGWTVAHFSKGVAGKGERVWMTPAAYDGKGFPDLIMVRERLMIRELKVGKNPLSLEQRMWIDLLTVAGVDVEVWTDKDWRTGYIEAVLRSTERMVLNDRSGR